MTRVATVIQTRTARLAIAIGAHEALLGTSIAR